MFISDMFKEKECVFSIEVFPPKKKGAVEASLYPALESMREVEPDFISVTYGAGGSLAGRSTTGISSHIKNELGIESLAHLTCANLTKEQAGGILRELRGQGVDNILVLRGDGSPDLPRETDYIHASDLAAEVEAFGGFDIAGACYPEGHFECPTLRQDVENLRYKVDAGVSHLITQLFFDNVCFYRFLNLARKAGIAVPVHAGVMPIVNSRQIERTVALSSASLPPAFTKMISRYSGDPDALFDAGIDYAVRQIRDLITGGADGIHLYAMNNAVVVRRVYEGIKDLLPGRSA